MPFTIPDTTRPLISVKAIPNKKNNKSPFTWYHINGGIYVMMKSNNGRARAIYIYIYSFSIHKYTINDITCDGYERISKQFGRIMIITSATGCVIFSGRYGIIIIWWTSRDDIEIYCFMAQIFGLRLSRAFCYWPLNSRVNCHFENPQVSETKWNI